jgi:heat shock protein HtpX
MMSTLKRIGLFLAVNILVVITISLVLNLLGIQPYLSEKGIDIKTLAIFCLMWGMLGSIISLLLSKTLAKFSMGLQMIPENTTHPQEKRLMEIITKLSKQAGLPKTPEVGIYRSPEVNAFATGASKRSSLVAVSSGLLQRMEEGEIEGVLGHEISHVANGDMVTMTLLQGIVNAFVMFLARVLAFVITRAGAKEDRVELGAGYTLFVFLFELLFMFLGMIVIAWFSRRREFRADEGGAALAGREKMVRALKKLQQVIKIQDSNDGGSSFRAFKISGPNGWMRLFSSHPPLEERIEHLLEIPLR